MVFACLMLSVFATIDQYEQTASAILFYMVSEIVPTPAAQVQVQVQVPAQVYLCRLDTLRVGPLNLTSTTLP